MAEQLDMFSISAIDPPWRDNRDAMEYPFLALQKRRTTPIRYSNGDIWLSVSAPADISIATIWDWDVMIFAASHINEAIESRRKVSPRISFVPHDLLKQIGRPIGGCHYGRLADAIRRLAATFVMTNIREADQPEQGEERGFHWLVGYSLPKKYPPRYITTPDNIARITPRNPEGQADPARPWEMHIHPWLFNAIVRRGDILAVHPDYFRLTGLKAIQADGFPLERPAWLLAVGRELERQWPGEAGEALLAECLHSRPTDAREGLLDAFIAAVRAAASEPPPST